MNCLLKTITKQHLLIFCDHFMGNDVFDPENMPDGIGQCLRMIPIHSCEGHLIEGLFREGLHDLGDLFKQTLSQSEKFVYPFLKRSFL